MKSKIVEVPKPPPQKSYKIDMKVSIYLKTNHLSVEAIEHAIYEAVKLHDGFAVASDIEVVKL